MNTIDLLNKLNLPTMIGLENDNAIFNKTIIMDAYLSASSLRFNKQLFGVDSTQTSMMNYLSINGIGAVMPRLSSNFDLFQRYTPEIDASISQAGFADTRILVDFGKSIEVKDTPKLWKEGSSQIETELDSYTKIEEKAEPKKSTRRGKRKIDKTNIAEFVADERRRLLKKIENTDNDRIVFKKRVKNSQKNPKISAENYRGSRYWGVSKNKSKWQVSILPTSFLHCSV